MWPCVLILIETQFLCYTSVRCFKINVSLTTSHVLTLSITQIPCFKYPSVLKITFTTQNHMLKKSLKQKFHVLTDEMFQNSRL